MTPEGLRLKNGTTVDADILVTATGLKLAVLSDIALTRDGDPIVLPETYSYKGMMFSDVPNLVQTFGYINASRDPTRRPHLGLRRAASAAYDGPGLRLRDPNPATGRRKHADPPLDR